MCSVGHAKDAAHGASDNELVIRRGLELREPSRAPLNINCFMLPSCPTSCDSESYDSKARDDLKVANIDRDHGIA